MRERKSPDPDLSWEEFVDDVQGSVWNAIQTGTLIMKISGETRLAHTTVTRFAGRETRNPSTRTVFLLAPYAGYRIAAIPNSVTVQSYERAFRRFRTMGPKRKA